MPSPSQICPSQYNEPVIRSNHVPLQSFTVESEHLTNPVTGAASLSNDSKSSLTKQELLQQLYESYWSL